MEPGNNSDSQSLQDNLEGGSKHSGNIFFPFPSAPTAGEEEEPINSNSQSVDDGDKVPLGEEPGKPSERLTHFNGLEEDDAMDISGIQGDILTGYLKDHQTMIFLHILDGEEDHFHRWLGNMEPLLGNKRSHLRHGEYNSPQATWLNIAYSVDAFDRLSRTAPKSKKYYFAHEESAPAGSLGSPGEKVPTSILAGSERISDSDNEADIVLVVASDSKSDMIRTVEQIENAVRGLRDDKGERVRSGAEVMFKQIGTTIEPHLTGHEPFGLKGSASQAASGARLFTQLENFLSPREHPDTRKRDKTGHGSSASWADKQTTDSALIQKKRVTYTSISHEYAIDMVGIQENAKRQFVPSYPGPVGLVPANYLRAWRCQVEHHITKGKEPLRAVQEPISPEGPHRDLTPGGWTTNPVTLLHDV